jgi:hypothetical protein
MDEMSHEVGGFQTLFTLHRLSVLDSSS